MLFINVFVGCMFYRYTVNIFKNDCSNNNKIVLQLFYIKNTTQNLNLVLVFISDLLY